MRGSLRRLPSPAVVLAGIALFVALGAGAYAATTLPANSVGTREIKDHAVTLKKIAASARRSLHGARGATGARGANGAMGQAGATGATGSNATINGVAAAGDLTGTYPAPTIAPAQPVQLVTPNGTACSAANPGAFCTGFVDLNTIGGFTDFAPVGFWIDRMGIVHLQGAARCAACSTTGPTAIFFLPVSDQPSSRHIFVVSTGAGAGRVDIGGNGIQTEVQIFGDPTNFVSLDGITYRP